MSKKMYSFRLPEELMEALREKADRDGVSATELVVRFIRLGLQNPLDKRMETLEEEVKSLQQQQQTQTKAAVASPMVLVPPSALVPDANASLQSEMAKIRQKIDSIEEKLDRQSPPNSD
ncbi:hypothetical protein IQ235_10505 [Oscillatoriales cyanobacterium LEGE 11467]|uniref:Uncharacterized protein n=1 Tax=Zarconia navalis LEGE 11467 TaxID=1828826 RepID=A0A928VVQ0_9CYAN|nr:hypothetical protein [Zarconia navalis]MBE9041209.1 hypothetical protein [Zarconia navalis LEGE 11467]